MSGITSYSIASLVEGVRVGTFSPMEVVQAFFERIEAEDSELNAWCYLDKEGALQSAKALTEEAKAGKLRGPLHGVPIGIKDNIEVEGMPTRLGSRLWENSSPSKRDAAIVKKLKEMGAIIIGKTHMTEYAWLDPAPTKNPHNHSHTPGGSSSGSAAAVAAHMIPLALGSQTAASVCRPAAYCGTVGFKPTAEPLYQDVKNLAPSFDTIGFFAKNVEDISAVMSTVEEPAMKKTITVGILSDPLYDACSLSLQKLMKETVAYLSEEYQQVIVKPEFHFQELLDLHRVVLAYETATLYKDLATEHEAEISKHFLGLIKEGLNISELEYQQTIEMIERIKDKFWKQATVDFFVTVPAPTPAPFGLETTGDPKFTTPWTVLGGPLSVIPGGFDEQGLPLSVMLAAAPHKDNQLLTYSQRVERYLQDNRIVRS